MWHTVADDPQEACGWDKLAQRWKERIHADLSKSAATSGAIIHLNKSKGSEDNKRIKAD